MHAALQQITTKAKRSCLINSRMTPRCKCVGRQDENSNEPVEAEKCSVEEKAQANPQLKDMGELWAHTDRCGRLGWKTTTPARFCKKH